MLRSLEIQNYRGLRHVVLDDLRRINIIIGPNATGKSSLLEALLIAGSGSPDATLKVRSYRGREGALTIDRSLLGEALFGELFSDFDFSKTVVLTANGDESGDRTIEMTRAPLTSIVTAEGEARTGEVGVKFTLKRPGHPPFEIMPRIVPQGFDMGLWPGELLSAHYIPSRSNVSETETARNYSALRISNNATAFEKAVLGEFPFLSNLSTEDPFGSSAIYASVNGVAAKVPLNSISGGISHIVGLLVRAAADPKSIFMIDEIENGIFHDRYEQMWRSLHALISENESQIFATTHSLEMVRALARALSDKAEDVAFIRTSRNTRGEIELEQFRAESMFGAVEIGDPR